MAAGLLLPNPLSLPSLPQMLSPGPSLWNDLNAKFHVRLCIPGNPARTTVYRFCFSPDSPAFFLVSLGSRVCPGNATETKSNNYSLALEKTYTSVGDGKDKRNTWAWPNVPRVTNVKWISSGNWIEWEVESLGCQRRLPAWDDISGEFRSVSRVLMTLHCLTTPTFQISPASILTSTIHQPHWNP